VTVPRRPFPIGRRMAVVLATCVAALACASALNLHLGDLWPQGPGATAAGRFFDGALHPKLPEQAPWSTLAGALWRTVAFAAVAMGVSVVLAIPLAVLASETFWKHAGDRAPIARRLSPVIAYGVRALIAVLRSIHELLWGVLLMAAMGLNSSAAVTALVIPFTGILAKVFAEMLDEAPRRGSEALRGLGAGPLSALTFGLLPAAAPDMAAYVFYRFECAIRASAVLGFFGFPTLGFHLQLAFGTGDYASGWAFLYTLLALVLLLEGWSAMMRKRVSA
jgi:ABC-type phosphate/phosphonate transport system permease subunit